MGLATQAEPETDYTFVQVSGPGSTAAEKRKVRAHAASNAKVRRQRVMNYQKKRDHKPEVQSQSAADIADWSGFMIPPGSPLSLLSASRTDPFNSFSRSVSPFEGYLLDHFVKRTVQSVVPCFPYLSEAEKSMFRDGMGTQWIQLAGGDSGMLASVFMVACRNLATLRHDEIYTHQALRYKSECIQMLQQELNASTLPTGNMTITKTLALASDAMILHDEVAARQHLLAAHEMVRLRGGVKSFEGTGFLEKLVMWFVVSPFTTTK